MKEPRKRDPVGRMDQIVEELSALYTEADLILESGPRELAVEPCSGACREAIELYSSTPPERWRAQQTL